MIANSEAASTGPLRKPKGRLWRRAVGWCGILIAILFLGMFGILEAIAHRPLPGHKTLTAVEIRAEDAHLKQLGLVVRDGSFEGASVRTTADVTFSAGAFRLVHKAVHDRGPSRLASPSG